MHIGVPRETKDREYRVGLTPDGARALVGAGHSVSVEHGAGAGSGFLDDAYREAGAQLVDTESAWSAPDLIVKVKEPNPVEVHWMRPGQILFTYLHLAANRELTEELREVDVYAIAYETIRERDGSFPLLAPMSSVAGRLAPQIGANLLLKEHGGKGLLLGGVPGVRRGRVTILGAGIVGMNAVRIAHGLGAEVDLLDVSEPRMRFVSELFRGEINTLHSNAHNIEHSVATSDLVIGAVYVQGRRPPTLVSAKLVAQMEPGSVVVDVAVDQGGCVETIRPTTHSHPTYIVDGVIHYGVANMPGAVPRTSTFALTNATLPLLERMADLGLVEAVKTDPVLAQGANVWRGEVVCQGVAESLGLTYRPLAELL